MFIPAGPFVFRYGVHKRRRSDVPNTAMWEIQGTRRCVSIFSVTSKEVFEETPKMKRLGNSPSKNCCITLILYLKPNEYVYFTKL